MEAVALLLKRGANVDAAMLNGCTALHLAVGRQDAAITTRLCQAGADKMIRNMEDETALDLADGNDDVRMIYLFKQKEEKQDKQGVQNVVAPQT